MSPSFFAEIGGDEMEDLEPDEDKMPPYDDETKKLVDGLLLD